MVTPEGSPTGGPGPPGSGNPRRRWRPGEPLQAGARVVFDGDFYARTALVRLADTAGLRVEDEVGERTDLVVANDAGSGDLAVRAAIALGVALIDEYTFETILERGRPATSR